MHRRDIVLLKVIAAALSLTALAASPVHAAPPWLPQILATMHLPALRWGMSIDAVARAVPETVRGPRCPSLHEAPDCYDLRIPDWRYEAASGSLGFQFKKGKLVNIEFEGQIASLAESTAVIHRLHELYDVPEPERAAQASGDDVILSHAMSDDTFFEYYSRPKDGAMPVTISLIDRRNMYFMDGVVIAPVKTFSGSVN
jgi:hypothetical protein